jgi:aminoglycoside phosphotransferase (APT) family kinase protein
VSNEPDAQELSQLLGGGTVTELRRLVGGASREMWAFRLDDRRLVLRRDPPGEIKDSGMEQEGALLRAAAQAGMRVPELLASGPSYLVLSWVDGEALARRILRDEGFATARTRLVAQFAEQLALLHTRVRPDQVPGLALADPVADVRRRLDAMGEPHPAFELGLRWLEEHRPPLREDAVVHGDFRLGNVMVDADGLAAVLDWELSHLGDPLQDLGWLCVRSWRFGARPPVAGLGTYQELAQAYEAAGGGPVDLEALHWWEVFGTLNWGVMCMIQARGHLERGVRSVELAAIGRRACEVELDLLDLLPGGEVHPEPPTPPAQPVLGPHDRPTATELVEAVREFLEGLPLTGHDRFLARVSSRVLQTVERELQIGPALAAAHEQRLAALGMRDDAELAAAIRSGGVSSDDVLPAVRAAVVDKLLVADPPQLIHRYDPPHAVPSQINTRGET